MGTGYDDIDNLNNQTNQLYDEQLKQQQNIINTSTQQTIDEIERNKQKTDEQVAKTNKALYTDYQKQINPYGANSENLAEQGLGGSGLAETTKANYYNTYQNAKTEATNNANTIKADFDAQIVKARQNGDLQMAQSALEMYKQKVNDLYNTYNLKFQQDQFAYSKEQDALAQSNWEKEYQRALEQANWERQFNQAQFDYNKSVNDRNYNYQVERDKVADNQWQKEYDLSKKASSSSRSSRSSGSSLNVKDTSNTSLSGVAEEVYSRAVKILKSQNLKTDTDKKNVVSNFLSDTYKRGYSNSYTGTKGNITADELRVITERLGI